MSLPVSRFALTKIQPPRVRSGLIERERLELALAQALAESRMVLVSAPAGFGKTSLLTRQIARLDPQTALAWIAADEDDDLSRLAGCAVAALEPYDMPWRTSPDAVIAALDGAPSAKRKRLADDFINTLLATDVRRGLIVIDDAHRIQDPTVFAFLDHVVERLPAHWGLVISTRVDPPMALARLRARGELAEFRQDELRFTQDEVQTLVDAADRTRGRDAGQLLDRTHGWPAGLGLALNSRGGSGASTERHLYDYFAAEVLAEMPAALRSFLLRCSVLPELDAQRCATVSGDPRAAQWLAEIERRGLFVSVRGEGEHAVLFLHDLFRDCLEDLLRRDHLEELPMLLRRAAAGEPDTLRRVAYLLRAGDTGEARRVAVETGPALLSAGAVGALARLLEQLPAAEREAPDVEFLLGLIAWARWDFETMRRAMHRAAAGYERDGHTHGRQSAQAHEALALAAAYSDDAASALLAGLANESLRHEARATYLHARLLRALEHGPLDEVASLYGKELDGVEEQPGIVSWYRATPTVRFVGLPGTTPLLRRYAQGARHSTQGATSALTVLSSLMQAWVELWCGAADEAATCLRLAGEDARWLDQSSTLTVRLKLCEAVSCAVHGDADGVSEALQTCLGLLEEDPLPKRRLVLQEMYEVLQLRLLAAAGRPDRVLQTARRLHHEIAASPAPVPAAERRAAQAYEADAAGRQADAIALWQASLREESLLRTLGLDMEIRLRLAAALLQSGRPAEEAATVIRPVLERAGDGSDRLPALLAGPVVLARLAGTEWGRALGAPERRQMAEWLARAAGLRGSAATSPSSASAPAPSPVPSPWPALASAPGTTGGTGLKAPVLSERERAVLERIAAGDSNKVIARTFELSPHTVKRHVANILDKLQLNSRGQAAAWFRDHA